MARLYPHLSKALGGKDGGIFDPMDMDPSVQKSMCGLLREFNALLSTAYELNIKQQNILCANASDNK
jgi:hypothetical protein